MRRIVKIQGFRDAGILHDWSMPASTNDFARVNVIYGGNGSGKSTLARVFSQMTYTDPTDLTLHVDVSAPNDSRLRVVDRSDGFWSRLRVFDKKFIQRNLLFDINGRSDALPLLVLGEPNISRDKRLGEIDARLSGLSDEIAAAQKLCKASGSAAKKLATDTARTISQELQSVGGRFAARSYDARRAIQALDALSQEKSGNLDTDIVEDLRIVQGQRMEPLSLVDFDVLDLGRLEAATATILRETITSIAIKELSGKANAELWVQQGLQLHAEHDRCLFCSSPLTPMRRDALERHFDASFTELQDRIKRLCEELDREVDILSRALSSAPDRGLLYADLREPYQEQMLHFKKDITRYSERIAALRDRLTHKGSEPFKSLDLGKIPGDTTVSSENVNTVLRKHNARSTDYQKAVAAAAHRIENARLSEIADAHREHRTSEAMNTGVVTSLQAEQASLIRERECINVTDFDSSPLAAELTRDVAALLGRDELTFAKVDDRYSIQRNGTPATALSEGEQTAISLLYFLCSLRDEKTKNIAATVIIDDPVSSLDQEILVGVSSHLWSMLVGNGSQHQVFLLTHSFELFRMWSNQLDRLPTTVKKNCSYSIYELRPRYHLLPDGATVRRPFLLSWTDAKLRAKLRSQYHYLFWRIADVLQNSATDGNLAAELEAAAVIPNAARQMLEAFLAFKYPSKIGDFEGSMRRAFDNGCVSDPLRQRVTRFLHRQSHNEEADIGRPVNIGEATTVLRSAFEFIDAVDGGHFEEMCAAFELNPATLLALPSTMG